MTVKITKDYAPVVSSGARSGIKMGKCIGVTIHNTDNDGSGANAKAHANLLKNGWKDKQQSWHFAVDEDGAYQSIPTDEVAWHAGDGGTGKGNTQTVAIEICMNSDGDLEKATDNAAELAAQVLKEKGLSADDLYQHHDWSGKNCPSQLRAGKPYSWSDFKNKVAVYFDGGSSTKPDTGSDTSEKTISQIADEVIAGKWGNGEEREKALKDAGYDYDAVQAEVNKRYGITSDSSTPNSSASKPSTSTKHKVGETVTINGVYTSNTSTAKLTPAVKTGKITKIVADARNPYLLNDGDIGWVNDDCIVSSGNSSGSSGTSAKKKLYLPASATSWKVYKTNVAPVVGNECGYLYPSKFGGLTYEILATPQRDVVTIQTRDYGKVNIYVAASTGAVIK